MGARNVSGIMVGTGEEGGGWFDGRTGYEAALGRVALAPQLLGLAAIVRRQLDFLPQRERVVGCQRQSLGLRFEVKAWEAARRD